MSEPSTLARKIAKIIADEIGAAPSQVQSAVALLDDGATVPFIARYRKEVTGGLDDTQLRTLETRLTYLRELEDRRKTILSSIEEQGKLTDALRADIEGADSKSRLEDLYLPYRPKRRTRAQIARESGLEPLADRLLGDPSRAPEDAAAEFVDEKKGVADVKAALDGARAILIERWGEDAELLGRLREWLWSGGVIRAKVVEGKEAEGAKYADYFDHAEPIARIPSHRLLALLRARREKVLELELEPGADAEKGHAHAEAQIAKRAGIEFRGGAADAWLGQACRLAWRAKIHVHLGVDLVNRAREAAEEHAIGVFGENLKDLLLAAPAGPRAVMGLDPGLRTGVKVAVVDRTGKLVAAGVIYPHEPKRRWEDSLKTLAALCAEHPVELIAIGNGTGSRETDRLVGELIAKHPERKLAKLVVSEAGASVYSASELAAREFPELDVSLRGAVSIARRLQDPLAELVKIEPKSIGVGQYQHDVDQNRLARALDARVEDCVNAVGVHVNTASGALLARVAGLSAAVADNVVGFRNEHGPFKRRKDLMKVPRLGQKAFEQCAGFLRIADGDEPLDGSAVHPEAYPVVERIAQHAGKSVKALIGDSAFLRGLEPEAFTDERFGVPTVRDILKELEKPGRDPRPEFKTARFAEGVEKLEDLKPGMILEGVVSNVAAFGAFVDIGVHQDGLVHISALSSKFVKDPREVVKAGEIVKVKVLDVDVARRRIALTLRLDDEPAAARERGERRRDARERDGRPDASRSRDDRPRASRGGEDRGSSRDGDERTGPRRGNRPPPSSGRSRDRAHGGREAPAGPYNTALADAFARAKKRGE